MKKQSALLATLLTLAFAAPAFAADKAMDKMTACDTDKNGTVSKEEAMKCGMTAEQFKKMDVNGDGGISKEEWMKTYQPG